MARGRMTTAAAFVAVGCALARYCSASALVPTPVGFWTLQEATGMPRQSSGAFPYSLIDGNASNPILQVDGGVLGPYSAYFPWTASNDTMRLFVDRALAPALTTAIAGPNATVTSVAWIRRSTQDLSYPEAMVLGVWNEHMAARQYALFTDLGACDTAPVFHHGLASHISDTGGPTPGQKYCITRACDPRPLPADAWHCLAGSYDGLYISAYVNGTLVPNFNTNRTDNPFYYPGGIYSPEATGGFGADFSLGANTVNHTVGGPAVWENRFVGRLGGVGVWNTSLTQAQIAAVCAAGAGFEGLAQEHGVEAWVAPGLRQ